MATFASASDCAPTLAGVWTVARADELSVLARHWRDTPGDVVVRCEELDRLDIATLQILLTLSRELGASGRKLLLTSLPETISHTVALAGLAEELLP